MSGWNALSVGDDFTVKLWFYIQKPLNCAEKKCNLLCLNVDNWEEICSSETDIQRRCYGIRANKFQ